MKKLLILLLVICSIPQLHATHLMGGEITWVCLKDGPDVGKYIFKLKLYRDCDGTTLSTFAQTIYVWDHPTVTQMSVDFILNQDISPDCDVTNSGNPQLDCNSNPYLLVCLDHLQLRDGILLGILVVEMEQYQI